MKKKKCSSASAEKVFIPDKLLHISFPRLKFIESSYLTLFYLLQTHGKHPMSLAQLSFSNTRHHLDFNILMKLAKNYLDSAIKNHLAFRTDSGH